MPRSIRIVFSIFLLIVITEKIALAEGPVLRNAKDCRMIPIHVAKKIKIPKGYHEGLFYDGKFMWVANGEGINTWLIDIENGSKVSEIKPIASFTEAITKVSDEIFFVTDWNEKKVYQARIADGKMSPQRALSVEPTHPAGVLWTGSRLFVIVWTRGLGTKFELLEMDGEMNILNRIDIGRIQEPDHLAWDGENLWIVSWFTKLVYRVDIDKWEVTGYFHSPVSLATGIFWDGKYFWLTGTYGDLYKIELMKK